MAVILNTDWYINSKYPIVVFDDGVLVAPAFGTATVTQRAFFDWCAAFNSKFGTIAEIRKNKAGVSLVFVDSHSISEFSSLYKDADIRDGSELPDILSDKINTKAVFSADDLEDLKRKGIYSGKSEEDTNPPSPPSPPPAASSTASAALTEADVAISKWITSELKTKVDTKKSPDQIVQQCAEVIMDALSAVFKTHPH